MNKKGYIFLHREELKTRLKDLKDSEIRLLLCCALMADWDKKHKNFGTFEKTIREIKAEQLSSWSTGKISNTINSLITKKFLTRISSSRLRVENYWLYRANSKKAEYAFQLLEQDIQPTEQGVQEFEQKIVQELEKSKAEITGKWKLPH